MKHSDLPAMYNKAERLEEHLARLEGTKDVVEKCICEVAAELLEVEHQITNMELNNGELPQARTVPGVRLPG